MNKEFIFNLLPILIPTFITMFIWGKNVENRLTEHSVRIQQLELTNRKVEVKLDDISNDLRAILVKLENKVDEKK